MEMTQLDYTIFAYFIAHKAKEIDIDGRYYPYLELLMSMMDKIKFSTRKFGRNLAPRAEVVGRHFLETMIAAGGFSVVQQEIGFDMHQFQKEKYRATLLELNNQNAIIGRSKNKGEEFWHTEFEQFSSIA